MGLGVSKREWTKKIHIPTFKKWYEMGVAMKVIASHFGCSLQSLRSLRRKLSLSIRSKRPGTRIKHNTSLSPRDVVLISGDNPIFDGAIGIIVSVESWGAVVSFRKLYWKTPGTVMIYRAVFSEIIRIGKLP